MTEHWCGDPLVRVTCQPVRYCMRHVEHVLDHVCQRASHTQAAVPHQGFENRETHAPELTALIVAEAGADDLSGQQTADARVGIVTQNEIRLARRCLIFGHGAANL